MTLPHTGLDRLPRPGTVPETMLAAVVKRDRYGPPVRAMCLEEVAVPPVGPRQALVMVMAAGVNYNGVWAALGEPLDVIAARNERGDPLPFHIGGSDASGVVWAVGDRVDNVRVGDAVVLTGSQWDESTPDIRSGGDPLSSRSQLAWGYETNFGSFAQFTVVAAYQCLPKPANLSWEEAGSYLVSGATAYRQLCGWPPHSVSPGDPVLVWGGGGGLGTMAIQITRLRGGRPIAVVSNDERAEHCLRFGAAGVIDRRAFSHWGDPPDSSSSADCAAKQDGLQAFAEAFYEALGERRRPRIVLEHPGRDTLHTSVFLCDNGGMIVSCGATTGHAPRLDLRYLWVRQKRLQGSHYASLEECRRVTEHVTAGELLPCLTRTLPFEEIAAAHQLMYENRHPPGKTAVLVNSPRPGLKELPGS